MLMLPVPSHCLIALILSSILLSYHKNAPAIRLPGLSKGRSRYIIKSRVEFLDFWLDAVRHKTWKDLPAALGCPIDSNGSIDICAINGGFIIVIQDAIVETIDRDVDDVGSALRLSRLLFYMFLANILTLHDSLPLFPRC